MNTKYSALIPAIFFVVMAASVTVNGAEQRNAEFLTSPIVLHAKDVLPAKLIRGNNYVINDRVQNDGLINTYELKTPYGSVTVESTEQLMARINELNAIQVMAEMDRQKVFGDALVAGVKAPVKGAINLVKAPVETTKGAIEGAGRFLSNIGRSVMSDDPHQDNAIKVALGYDAAKRGFAYEFGINPYSSYEPAMSKLGEIAQASVAGGLAPRAAMAAVDSGVVTALRVTGTAEGMRKLVRDNPPGELEKINRAKLEGMNINPSLIDTFLNNYAFDPQEKTLLVGELERLKGIKGRETFLAAASLVTRQQVALFYRTTAQMMAGYNTEVSPVSSIERIGGTPYLMKKDGTAVLVLPLDFIFRTKQVASKLKTIDSGLEKTGGITAKELWITGKVDKDARKMLTDAGWKITESTAERLLK